MNLRHINARTTWLARLVGAALACAGCKSHTTVALPEVEAPPLATTCPPAQAASTLAIGQRVYMRVCASCHQMDGRGLAGIFPPLAGHAGRLAQNKAGRDYLGHLVLWGLSGPITVDGKVYQNVMPPQAGMLKDDEIAAVLSYVMHNFDNCRAFASMPVFATEDVARLRQTAHSGLETFMLRKTTDFARTP